VSCREFDLLDGGAKANTWSPALKPVTALPTGFDDTGQLRSKNRLPRFEDAENETAHEPEPAQDEASRPPIAGRHRGGVNPDQNFVVLGCGLWHFGKADVFDYIERFYNARRRHSTIGYLSPVEFKELMRLASVGVNRTGSSSGRWSDPCSKSIHDRRSVRTSDLRMPVSSRSLIAASAYGLTPRSFT
jgi:hypothetical protein